MKPLIDRLLAKIEIDQETGCWNWKGCLDRYGYGKIRPAPKTQPIKAHRASYEHYIGPIPVGEISGFTYLIMHSCDNRRCINPNHLRFGTHHENSQDKHNTNPPHERHNYIMPNLNQVTLCGNLTRDPEIKYTSKGTAVADLSLAINSREKVGEEWKDKTTFVDVTAWGRQAENAEKFLKKGRGVLIIGKLELDQWDDKATGQKRSKLKIVANDVQFLPDAATQASSERARETRTQREAREASSAPSSRAPAEDQDDDIPF
jgi:single-strand DNA-binding protein